MKKFLVLFAGILSLTSANAQCSFGNYPPTYTNPSAGNPVGYWFTCKYTLSSTATLFGLGLESLSASGSTLKMAIYSDVSNAPGSLVAETGTANVVAGPNVLNVTNPVTLNPGSYWIAAIFGTNPGALAFGNTGAYYYCSGSVNSPAPATPAWASGGTPVDLDYWAVINTPLLTIIGSNTVCSGNSISLTAGGASTYTWSNGSNSSSVIVSPTVSGNYTVTGTNAQGCVGSDTKSITVTPSPTVTATTSSSMLCAGQSATLTASGANTYTWSMGLNSTVVVISPTTTTNYTVTGEANGCVNTATVSQNVSNCVGITRNSNEGFDLAVFPNPGNGIFTILVNSKHETSYLEIYNVIGKLIIRKNINEEITDVNLREQSSGIYFLKYTSGNATKTIKLVKE